MTGSCRPARPPTEWQSPRKDSHRHRTMMASHGSGVVRAFSPDRYGIFWSESDEKPPISPAGIFLETFPSHPTQIVRTRWMGCCSPPTKHTTSIPFTTGTQDVTTQRIVSSLERARLETVVRSRSFLPCCNLKHRYSWWHLNQPWYWRRTTFCRSSR